MKTYSVHLAAVIDVGRTVTVVADSPEMAEHLAIEMTKPIEQSHRSEWTLASDHVVNIEVNEVVEQQ